MLYTYKQNWVEATVRRGSDQMGKENNTPIIPSLLRSVTVLSSLPCVVNSHAIFAASPFVHAWPTICTETWIHTAATNSLNQVTKKTKLPSRWPTLH